VTTPPKPTVDLTIVAISMTEQLRRLLRGFTGNWATTQDLLQDVQVRLLRCSVRDPAKATALIYRIAQNIGRDWKRREKGSPVEFRHDIEELPQLGGSVSPERYAIARQLLDKLTSLLPARCLYALSLVKGEGYTHQEAANQMNIEISTVRTHLRNAVLYIRQAMLDGDL
jgi:RNA polymerase sigma factor (sigma-70 family)